jgi:hypothetical protein
MTDDNSNLVDMDNLSDFSAEFFKDSSESEKAEAKVEDVPETDDDTVATKTDVDAPQEEELEDDDASKEDEEEAPKPEPKKRQSAKERIEELYANTKRLERELAALKAGAPKEEVKPEAETAPDLSLPDNAPKHDAVDNDGNLLYPLGEFDPLYIRDLTVFFNKKAMEDAKAEAAKQEQAKTIEAEKQALTERWQEAVAAAEEDLPDIREKLADMVEAFEGVDPNYGEFLAASIMSCDNGPQIMYFLSQNIGEAQKIVASGPQAAILTLGRLDAKFTKPTEEKRNKKPSNAPEPPQNRTRGNAGKFEVADDTDDLAAFKRKFFK